VPEEKGKSIVTSMKVDGDIWKKAKIQAIQEDITLTELLNEALELRIKDASKFEKQKKTARSEI